MSEQESASGSQDESSPGREQTAPEGSTSTSENIRAAADPYALPDDTASGAPASPAAPDADDPIRPSGSDPAVDVGGAAPTASVPLPTNPFGAPPSPEVGAPLDGFPSQQADHTAPAPVSGSDAPHGPSPVQGPWVGAPNADPHAPVAQSAPHDRGAFAPVTPSGDAASAPPFSGPHPGYPGPQAGTGAPNPLQGGHPFAGQPAGGAQVPNGSPYPTGPSAGHTPGTHDPNGNPYATGPAPAHAPGTLDPNGNPYAAGPTPGHTPGTHDPNGNPYAAGPVTGTLDPNGNPYATGPAPGHAPGTLDPNGNPYAGASPHTTGYPTQNAYPDPNGNPYATGPAGTAGIAPGAPGGPGATYGRPAWFTSGVAAATGIHAAIVFGALIAGGILMTLFTGILASSQSDIPSPVTAGNAVPMIVQLAALIVSGALELSTGPMAAGMTISGSVSMLPLLVTGLVLVTTIVTAVSAERRAVLPSFGTRVLVSAATGAAVSLVLMLLTLALPVSLASSGIGVDVSARAVTTFLFGTVLIGAAALVGRLAATTSTGSPFSAPVALLRRSPRWFRETLTYAAIGTIATTAATLVFAIVIMINEPEQAGAVLGSFPLFLNTVVFVAGLAHLGGVTFDSTTNVGGFVDSSTSDPMVTTVFSAGSPWALLLVLVAIATTFATAVRIGAMRGRPTGFDPRTFWRFPLAVFVGWLVVGLVLATVSLTASGSFALGSASSESRIGLTVWTPLVILLWAVAIEFAAPYAAIIAYTISPRLLTVLAGAASANAWITGTTPVVPGTNAFAPGTVGAPAPVGPTPGPPVADGAASWPGAAPLTPSPENGAAYFTEPANGAPTLSPSARKGVLVGGIVAGAIVVALIAGTIVVGVVNGANSPEAAARQYLEAIASGDAERANELVDPNIPTGDRTLLTNATMAGATELISDLKVTSAEETETGTQTDTRYVTVSYRLGGVEQTGMLEVRRGENTALVFESWDVVTPILVPIEVVTEQPTPVTVGGGTIDIAAGEADYQGEVDASGTPNVYVYPGTYPVTGTDTEFFTFEPTSVEAASPELDYGTQSVELVSAPTDALQAAVQEAVDATLDECVTSTKSSPEGCPFAALLWTTNPVTWSITAYPTVEILGGTTFEAEDLSFGYSFTSYANRTQTGTDTIDFSGTYQVVDGKVTVDIS